MPHQDPGVWEQFPLLLSGVIQSIRATPKTWLVSALGVLVAFTVASVSAAVFVGSMVSEHEAIRAEYRTQVAGLAEDIREIKPVVNNVAAINVQMGFVLASLRDMSDCMKARTKEVNDGSQGTD